MEFTIKINTPKGQALKTSQKISKFIIPPWKNIRWETWTNAEDNEVYWHVIGTTKDYMKVVRNINYYDSIMRGALDSTLAKKQIEKLPKADQEELRRMLLEETKIELIKISDYEKEDMLNHYTRESWWERTKIKLGLKKETS